MESAEVVFQPSITLPDTWKKFIQSIGESKLPDARAEEPRCPDKWPYFKNECYTLLAQASYVSLEESPWVWAEILR